MKNFKRFLAMMITCIMAITLCAVTGITAVAADGQGTITINSGDSAEHNYVAYQIFTGNVTTDDGKTIITNAEWSEGVLSGIGEIFLPDFVKGIEVDGTKIFGDDTSAAKVAEKMSEWDNNSPEAQAFAKAIVHRISNFGGGFIDKAISFTGSNGTYTTNTTVDPGYYLIIDTKSDTDGRITEHILALVGEEGLTINAKPDVPTIEKKIVDGKYKVEANFAGVGKKITYELTGNIIDASGYNKFFYVIEDTLSPGLDFDKITRVYLTTADGDNGVNLIPTNEQYDGNDRAYYFETSENADGSTNLKIVITNYKQLNTDGYTGGTIRIEYDATLNENAVIGGDGNPNTVQLKYSNNPNHGYESKDGAPWEPAESGQPMGVTAASKVVTYTTGIQINKVDGLNGTALKGATFTIKANSAQKVIVAEIDEDGNETKTIKDISQDVSVEATVDDDGILTFTGLGTGEYTITETKAPDGYNKLTDPITVTITSSELGTDDWTWSVYEFVNGTYNHLNLNANDLYELKVENNKGSTLPGTGGIGTTIFYAGGSILLFVAAALFIIKKRKDAKSE